MARAWIPFNLEKFCGDHELQCCPLDTQGFMVHLMKVLNRSHTPGYLDGKLHANPVETLGFLLPFSKQTIRKHLANLKVQGVLKQNEQGVWYNKGMYEDWLEYRKSQEDGAKGGNPKLKGEGLTPPVKGGVKGGVKAEKNREDKSIKEGGRSAALISSANKIKGWNFTPDEDADFFPRLLADFPEPLIIKTIEDLRTYQERPAKQYKNLHSTLRNWCKREAERMEPEDVRPEAKLDPDGNPMYPLNGEWVTRKELDRMIAAGDVIRKGEKWERQVGRSE